MTTLDSPRPQLVLGAPADAPFPVPAKSDFGVDGERVEFLHAGEVRRIAEGLIHDPRWMRVACSVPCLVQMEGTA